MLLSLYIFHINYSLFFFFFFNDTATTEIYTLSLHDALPIYQRGAEQGADADQAGSDRGRGRRDGVDRKSTRLNSSHLGISYAVFCLKKKKNKKHILSTDFKTKTQNTAVTINTVYEVVIQITY